MVPDDFGMAVKGTSTVKWSVAEEQLGRL